jgi:hypothetical protein
MVYSLTVSLCVWVWLPVRLPALPIPSSDSNASKTVLVPLSTTPTLCRIYLQNPGFLGRTHMTMKTFCLQGKKVAGQRLDHRRESIAKPVTAHRAIPVSRIEGPRKIASNNAREWRSLDLHRVANQSAYSRSACKASIPCHSLGLTRHKAHSGSGFPLQNLSLPTLYWRVW